MQYSDSTSLISDCNELVLSYQLSKVDSQIISDFKDSISISRGETLTIAALSQTTSDVGASMNWEELY